MSIRVEIPKPDAEIMEGNWNEIFLVFQKILDDRNFMNF